MQEKLVNISKDENLPEEPQPVDELQEEDRTL